MSRRMRAIARTWDFVSLLAGTDSPNSPTAAAFTLDLGHPRGQGGASRESQPTNFRGLPQLGTGDREGFACLVKTRVVKELGEPLIEPRDDGVLTQIHRPWMVDL